MLIFMDTSAMVKRYVEEQGSERVDGDYVPEIQIAIAPITAIEFHSAMKRKKKNEMVRYNKHIRRQSCGTRRDFLKEAGA